MISDDALNALAGELFELLTHPKEFDRIYMAIEDNYTAVVMRAERNGRECGFRYKGSQNIDLQTGLDCLRGYFRRMEVN